MYARGYVHFLVCTMFLILLIKIGITTATMQSDPAAQQLEKFLEKHPFPVGILTTSAGRPVPYSEATCTLNKHLVFNEYFMDTMSHLTRERIPERVVHASGAGAFGYFKVTHNISHICKASLFSKIGKITPVAVRFSPIAPERGSSDTTRDGRGFAIKFYTDEGNLDIVGLNQPVFVIKDPILFPSFVHSQKRNPATNLHDANAYWDFLTLYPETLNMFLRVLGDDGIPNGYGNMPGFSIHTYQIENSRGDVFYARFHFIPDGGIKTLTSQEAREIGVVDPDYNARKLYNSIENGNFPSWTVALQVITAEQIKIFGYDYIFDVTRTLSVTKHPLTKVGKLVLNFNALNYHAEIEQLAFNPANRVSGVHGAPDDLFQGRLIAYRDSLYHRLPNFNNIKVNRPLNEVFVYSRDGRPPVGDNQENVPNYIFNSFNGPMPSCDNSQPLISIVENKPNNIDQMTDLYVNEMTSDHRNRLIENIVYSLGPAADFIKDRAVKIFTKIHPDLGNRVQQGLEANTNISTQGDGPNKKSI